MARAGVAGSRGRFGSHASAFSPVQVSAVSGWFRLAASTAVTGEWPTVVDVLNPGFPLTSGAIPAVGTSANGLPTGVWDGSDVWVVTAASPSFSSTTKWGLWFWIKPASFASIQLLLREISGVSGMTLDRFELSVLTDGSIRIETYITNTNGRRGITAASLLTVGTWTAVYLQYDSSRGGDANVAVFTGGVSRSLSMSNLGTGGTLTTLQALTGTPLFGGNNAAGGSGLLNNTEVGPNIFTFNNNLTATQIANFLAFEVPT